VCVAPVSPRAPRERCFFLRFIDFASATSEDLGPLLAACDPATFGRGNEDIYDESYRKAFKMDASDFIVHPNITGSGLMRTIEYQLLQSGMENKYIRAELYKLNVYSKYYRGVSPGSAFSDITAPI